MRFWVQTANKAVIASTTPPFPAILPLCRARGFRRSCGILVRERRHCGRRGWGGESRKAKNSPCISPADAYLQNEAGRFELRTLPGPGAVLQAFRPSFLPRYGASTSVRGLLLSAEYQANHNSHQDAGPKRGQHVTDKVPHTGNLLSENCPTGTLPYAMPHGKALSAACR